MLKVSCINIFFFSKILQQIILNDLSLRNESRVNRTSLNAISCIITSVLTPAKYSVPPPESIKTVLRRPAEKLETLLRRLHQRDSRKVPVCARVISDKF